MAQLRLNKEKREYLLSKAMEISHAVQEKNAWDVACSRVHSLVKAHMDGLTTGKERKVLEKFKAMRTVEIQEMRLMKRENGDPGKDFIRVQLWDHVDPLKGAEMIRAPKSQGTHVESAEMYNAAVTVQQAHITYNEATQAHKAAFGEAIHASRTLEDLAEVWPDAETYRGALVGGELATIVSKEARAFIQKATRLGLGLQHSGNLNRPWSSPPKSKGSSAAGPG